MSMDGKAPHLLPLSAAKKKIRDEAVPLVCGWALINIFSTAVSYIAVDYIPVSCTQSSFILPCIELTHAEEARVIALSIGILCCAPLQTAAAAPMPPSLGPPCPRLPRARGHRPLPLHVRRHRLGLPRRRPRIHLRQDLLHRGLLLHRGVRPPQLPGPPGR